MEEVFKDVNYAGATYQGSSESGGLKTFFRW